MRRVADLMRAWAEDAGLSPHDIDRWAAAGLLHDALRDADPDALRPLVEPALRDLPGPMLHGPAAAARLRAEGVADEPVLRAIAWHTPGHPALDALGRSLYLADYTEPGRDFDPEWLDQIRRRLPREREAVLRDVLAREVGRRLGRGERVHPSTIELWNAVVE